MTAPHLPPAARPSIVRRERRSYRIEAAPTPDPVPALAPHLVRLSDDWALWRTVCLRAPGFPVDLVGSLGAPELAEAADAVLANGGDQVAEAQYAKRFAASVDRLSVALHGAAGTPRLREAIAWQNRRALDTGIDSLLRKGPKPERRNTKHRQHEALLASYLQRYCAKNDTIGFFGPVSWSQIDDGAGIRVTHTDHPTGVRGRATYLEGWAVLAVLAGHTAALRPWLVPRRMPFLALDGDTLRPPLSPPLPLTPAEAVILRACDGVRNAIDIAATVLNGPNVGLTDPAEVFAVLARLAQEHRVSWQVDVAPQDIEPERSVRAQLARVTDEAIRGAAEEDLDRLTAARDVLADAGGDPDAVYHAMADLESVFTGLTGESATRRAGGVYAGRTLAYEECLRADTVRLGVGALDGVREALSLVLDSARWFTAASGALYTRHFQQIHRQRSAAHGSGVVPFNDFWLLANESLFGRPPTLIQPAVRELQRRWAAILGLPSRERRIRLVAADLHAAVADAFPAPPRVWPMAVHHSPDLMIAGADAATGGRPTWVLGELHPSNVTTRYASWLRFHDDPEAVRAALRHDLGGPAVFLAETGEDGGVSSRLSNVLTSPDDLRLVYAHDSCGYDPAITLAVGDCDVVDTPAGLRLRSRDGAHDLDLLEALGDVLAAVLAQTFQMVARSEHTPRITVDDLVLHRESWRFPATAPAFATVADERARYLQARRWAGEHGLPRHVFLRFSGEEKPIYADLTSLASIDLISRSTRRARQEGPDATVTVAEMLPGPQQAWLNDAQGHRYTAELRLVAVDQRTNG